MQMRLSDLVCQPLVTSYVIDAYLCLAMFHAWTLEQLRRNRGFRRFSEPGPSSYWGPRVVGKTLRKIIKIVATR